MAAVIPFVTATAAVLSVVGTLQQGAAASSAAKYNARVAEQNARIAREQAASSAEQQRISNQRKLGSIRAGYGAAGVTSDGSPMDVLADSYTQGEYDVQNILYQGELRAAGYQNDANLSYAEGRNARRSSYVNAASRALVGGQDFYEAGQSAKWWE